MRILSIQSPLAQMASSLSVVVVTRQCGCGTSKATPWVNLSRGMRILSIQSPLAQMASSLSVVVLAGQCGCGTSKATPWVILSRGIRILSIQSPLAQMASSLLVVVMTTQCGCGEGVGGSGSKSAVTDYVTIPCLKILRLRWRSKPAKLVKSMCGVKRRVKSRG
jgi:hypothetical protein